MALQASDARKELLEKERETQNLKQEVVGLKKALKDANDQCVLLYSEVQRAWKVSFTLQSDLKVIQLYLGSCLAFLQFFITSFLVAHSPFCTSCSQRILCL